MSIPTYAEVIARIETDLSQATIEGMIAAAVDAVASRHGPDDERTEDLDASGPVVFLRTRAEEILSIVEGVGATETTLAANDWRLEYNGMAIRRLATGTNQRANWGNRVRVIHAPAGGAARKAAIVNLVHLEIQYSGLASHSAGDYSEQQRDYRGEREKILATLDQDKRQIA
jgi:hypothetical protein